MMMKSFYHLFTIGTLVFSTTPPATVDAFTSRTAKTTIAPSSSTSTTRANTATMLLSSPSSKEKRYSILQQPGLIASLLERPSYETTTSPPSSSSSLPKLWNSIPTAFGLSSAIASTMALLEPAAAAAASTTTTSSTIISNINNNNSIEAHLFTLLSHVGLDLAVFFAPGMIFLRVLAILGRLCTMAADYIPDHMIFPEELAFQIGMLTIAWIGLFKAAFVPIVSSTVQSISMKDKRAYLTLFQPAGTSWEKYKALSACAMDWITIDAGTMVSCKGGQMTTSPGTTSHTSQPGGDDDDDQYAYWLYSGQVQVESSATGEIQYTVSRLTGKTFKQDAPAGLLGERRLLGTSGSSGNHHLVDASSSSSATKTQSSKKTGSPISNVDFTATSTSIIHALTPSTLLRIHIPSVKLLMENDLQLAESIRTLVYQGLEVKLQTKVRETAHLLQCLTTAGTAGATSNNKNKTIVA